jgi:hypothetical protein
MHCSWRINDTVALKKSMVRRNQRWYFFRSAKTSSHCSFAQCFLLFKARLLDTQPLLLRILRQLYKYLPIQIFFRHAPIGEKYLGQNTTTTSLRWSNKKYSLGVTSERTRFGVVTGQNLYRFQKASHGELKTEGTCFQKALESEETWLGTEGTGKTGNLILNGAWNRKTCFQRAMGNEEVRFRDHRQELEPVWIGY